VTHLVEMTNVDVTGYGPSVGGWQISCRTPSSVFRYYLSCHFIVVVGGDSLLPYRRRVCVDEIPTLFYLIISLKSRSRITYYYCPETENRQNGKTANADDEVRLGTRRTRGPRTKASTVLLAVIRLANIAVCATLHAWFSSIFSAVTGSSQDALVSK